MKYPIKLEYIKCDLYKTDNTKFRFQFRGEALKVSFRIVECKNCGLVFVNPRSDISLTKEICNSACYAGYRADKFFLGKSATKIHDAKLLLKSLTSYLKATTTNFIEVGGGEEYVALVAKDYGINEVTTDLSSNAVDIARSSGCKSILGELLNPKLAH